MRIQSALLTAAAIAAMGCTKHVSFRQDVFPVLREKCLECHKSDGEGYTKSGLNLETYEGLMKGTRFGPVVQPGSSVSSTLVILIERKADPSINMPHGKDPLPKDQVELIKQWIDQGAKNN